MRRSTVEAAVSQLKSLAQEHGLLLPPFAHWSRQEWTARRDELKDLVRRGIGWDVTDYGSGDFSTRGLCLLTLRNGTLAERDAGRGQTYAEKLMLSGVGQETPLHAHRHKTEDIINRGGGTLVVEVHTLDDFAPRAGVQVDSVTREVPSGERVRLEPGQSIQLPAGVYHRFWAEGSPVLAGEVSGVNDDAEDNVFAEDLPRFSEIEEDTEARHLLVSEYAELLSPPVQES